VKKSDQLAFDRLRLLMAAGRATTAQIIRCAELEIQHRAEQPRVWVGRPAVEDTQKAA